MTKVTTVGTYRELSQEMLLAKVLQVLATHSQTVNFLQKSIAMTAPLKWYRVPYCFFSHKLFKVTNTITGLLFFNGTNAKKNSGSGFSSYHSCLVPVA
jgi:hypothetical protein